MVRINGEKVPQDSISKEEFNGLLEKKLDSTMKDLCFDRDKTAQADKEVDKHGKREEK